MYTYHFYFQDEEFIHIKEGSIVVLTCDISQYNKCNKRCIFVDNPFIAIDTKVGTTITIAHDEIILTCKKILGETSIKCVVVKSGNLKSLCLVCARGAKRTRPFITKKDLQIVQFAIEQLVGTDSLLSKCVWQLILTRVI